MRAVAEQVDLICHPSNAAEPVRRITAGVLRSKAELTLTFLLHADLARVRVPAPRAPAVAHRLWEHTCFEAFVALDDRPAYHELNLSPSGEWVVYTFSSYREIAGMGDAVPDIAVRTGADCLELTARLSLAALSDAHRGAALRLGLSAVVEEAGGGFSYWALRHPSDRPDFHHADAFALRLEPPAAEW